MLFVSDGNIVHRQTGALPEPMLRDAVVQFMDVVDQKKINGTWILLWIGHFLVIQKVLILTYPFYPCTEGAEFFVYAFITTFDLS